MSGGLTCGGAAIAAAMCVSLSASATTPMDIQRALVIEANQNQVPVSLALAVAKVESGFNAGALSPVGARGVMQIMPATAMGEFGVEADRLWDAGLNVQLGVQYLKRLHETYGGRWDLALSHYNGGTVKGDTPSSYTVDYVLAVQAWQAHYEQRGCNRLTAKRIVTHADSVALCLQGDGPIRNASLTVDAATAAPEPTPPTAAPQTPVTRSDLPKPAPTPVTKPQPDTLKTQLETLKAPPETAKPAPAVAVTAEPEPTPEPAQPTPSPKPAARSATKVAAAAPQPWLPSPQPAQTVTAVEVPVYDPVPTYYGRPRRPGMARGMVAFRGAVGPRGRRWW